MLLVTWKPVGMREVILYTLANTFNLTVMLQKYNDSACVLCQYFWCGPSCCSTCALTNDLSYVTEKQHFLERLSLETTNFLCTSWTFQFCLHSHAGLSTPHVYWWWVGDRWRNNGGHMTSFFGEKKARKRCCFNCNIWPNWFTSHQSHYCLYNNGIPEFVGNVQC